MDSLTSKQSLSDVQDILYLVFPYLDPERSIGEDQVRVRQTLLRSAIACRTFARPALDTLWKCLPDDKPLVSLLCLYGIAKSGDSPSPRGIDKSYVRA